MTTNIVASIMVAVITNWVNVGSVRVYEDVNPDAVSTNITQNATYQVGLVTEQTTASFDYDKTPVKVVVKEVITKKVERKVGRDGSVLSAVSP